MPKGVKYGYFGNLTKDAVDRYKKDHGLGNTGKNAGKVGGTTWRAIGMPVNSRVITNDHATNRFNNKEKPKITTTTTTNPKVTPAPPPPKKVKTIEETVNEFDGKKAREDIWKGMTSQGWTPYKNTAYSVANAHAGVVGGLVLDKIIPSSGDPALDKATEQVGYASLISPSTWIDVHDLYKDAKKLLEKFK